MTTTPLSPVEVHLRAAHDRARPLSYVVRGTNVTDLLAEVVQLAKLAATEERDMAVIRAHHELQTQELKNAQERALLYITSEYQERASQMTLLHEGIKLLMSMNQFDAAQTIMLRLTDILADSPLKRAGQLR